MDPQEHHFIDFCHFIDFLWNFFYFHLKNKSLKIEAKKCVVFGFVDI